MFERIKKFFMETDKEPEVVLPDMLEKLLNFDKYYDYAPKAYDTEYPNPFIRRIINDYSNQGWGASEGDMEKALQWDDGACRDILIKHMQNYPKHIEQPKQGIKMMFARSLGNSDNWHNQYEARQAIYDFERQERYDMLGLKNAE